MRPWDAWRMRHGLPHHPSGFAGFGGCRRASTLSFGCDKSANPLETHYARMTAGDPNAIAAAARLAAKEKAGTASAAELAALWGLRAMGENDGSYSPAPSASSDPAARAMVLLRQSMQAQGGVS